MRCTHDCRPVTHLLRKRVESGPIHEAPEDKSLSKEWSDGDSAGTEEMLEDLHICSINNHLQSRSFSYESTAIPSAHKPIPRELRVQKGSRRNLSSGRCQLFSLCK